MKGNKPIIRIWRIYANKEFVYWNLSSQGDTLVVILKKMRSNFTIFFSWQSDISKNRNVIFDCLKKAIKNVKTQLTAQINLEINLDRDTQDQTGSPEISNTILQKISSADIFVSDVTIINNSLISRIVGQRFVSNPNVLFELGYAVNQLGWERIICINNLSCGKLEDLPFDIRNHRTIGYSSYKINYKKELTQTLTLAIKTTIENYESIIENFNSDKLIQHDIRLFEEQDKILPETLLNDSLSSATNSLFSDRYYYSRWDMVIDFYSETKNHFIDSELHEIFTEYLDEVDSFRLFCIQNLTVEKIEGETIRELRMKEREITEDEEYQALINERFFAHKEPFRNETWDDSDKRIWKIQDEFLLRQNKIKELYKKFIVCFTKLSIKK